MAEAKGLRWALYALLAVLALILVLTLPSGTPLRNPENGDIIGDSPFMSSLIVMISLAFGAAGVAFGRAVGTVKNSDDALGMITKSSASLASLLFLFLLIAQFIAYFDFSNIAKVTAIALGDVLERLDLAPLMLRLGVNPQTVLAAYRTGDSPTNVLTPLMPYFALMVVFAARYQKSAGIGTVIALMVPYTLVLTVVWTAFFLFWYALGIPLGPGSPV